MNDNEVHLDVLSLPLYGESSYVTLKINESEFDPQLHCSDNAVLMGSQPDNYYEDSNSESDNDNEIDDDEINDIDYNLNNITNVADFDDDTNHHSNFMEMPRKADHRIVPNRPQRNRPSRKFLEGFQSSQDQENQEDLTVAELRTKLHFNTNFCYHDPWYLIIYSTI